MVRFVRHAILMVSVFASWTLPTSASAQYRQPSHGHQAQVRYYFGSPSPYTYGHAAPSFQWGSFGAYKRTYQFSGQQHSYHNDFFQQSFR